MASIPNTKRAIRNVSRRTAKRMGFFVKNMKTRAKKFPSYLDRMMSRVVRSVTRRR